MIDPTVRHATRISSRTALLEQRKPSPLGDLGGVQALLAQVRPTTALGERRLVGGHMVQFLRGRERPTTGRATKAWLRSIHSTIVGHGCKS
jgi:hypothetical protein